MHPWVQKWTCAESWCWQCINLCEPKRAISESLPMKARLFPHLQPLTAVTLNQCLWIVWLGQPPLPPQSNACLLLYILSILFFTFRCLHPHHFHDLPPKGAFYFYYKILILFDDRHLTVPLPLISLSLPPPPSFPFAVALRRSLLCTTCSWVLEWGGL